MVLLLVATLVTRLAQQLAVLLLGHPLAALLDDGAHGSSQFVDRVARDAFAGSRLLAAREEKTHTKPYLVPG
ncbi:hypothetical protein JCM9957A_42290 [Kineosporia succinea]